MKTRYILKIHIALAASYLALALTGCETTGTSVGEGSAELGQLSGEVVMMINNSGSTQAVTRAARFDLLGKDTTSVIKEHRIFSYKAAITSQNHLEINERIASSSKADDEDPTAVDIHTSWSFKIQNITAVDVQTYHGKLNSTGVQVSQLGGTKHASVITDPNYLVYVTTAKGVRSRRTFTYPSRPNNNVLLDPFTVIPVASFDTQPEAERFAAKFRRLVELVKQ
jgi:hypothetical protein